MTVDCRGVCEVIKYSFFYNIHTSVCLLFITLPVDLPLALAPYRVTFSGFFSTPPYQAISIISLAHVPYRITCSGFFNTCSILHYCYFLRQSLCRCVNNLYDWVTAFISKLVSDNGIILMYTVLYCS